MKKKALINQFPHLRIQFFGLFFLLIFSSKSIQAQDVSYVVGSGYDITQYYADITNCKESLFDIRTEGGQLFVHGASGKHPIEVRSTPATNYVEIFGSSLQEYMSSFANKTSISGSYGLFSGSLSVDFSLNKSGSMQNDFMTIRHYVDLKVLKLPYNVSGLVKPAAQRMIDDTNTSPETLFDRFGTHYIWEAPIGGRADFNFQYDKATQSSSFNLEVAAKVEYNSLASSASISNQTNVGKSKSQINEKVQYNIKTYGGDANKGGARIRQDRQNGMNEWAASVAKNPTLSRFTKSSLRPIWELCTNESRKAQIKAAFDNYVKGNSILNQPPKLDVRVERNLTEIISDWGMGSDIPLTIYKPTANNGYFLLGHVAERRHGAAQGSTLLVKDVSGSKNSLAKPVSWKRVWGDWGSGGDHNVTIWQAVCPADYVALGQVSFNKYDLPKGPTAVFEGHPFKDFRCVNKRLTVPATAREGDPNRVWGDWGTGADHDVIIHKVLNNSSENHYDGTYFYAQSNHGKPTPNPPLYMLKKPAEVPMPKRPTVNKPNRNIAPTVLAVNTPKKEETKPENKPTPVATTATTTTTTTINPSESTSSNEGNGSVVDVTPESTNQESTDGGTIFLNEGLEIACITNFTNIYKDFGTGSDIDLSIWCPVLEEGYYALGHSAKAGYDAPTTPMAVVYPLTEDAIAHPTDYELIWKDSGSGGDQDLSIWEPIAPAGYVALGTVAQQSYDKPALDAVVCVREDLTTFSESGAAIWNDAGSGADQDCGLWQIENTSPTTISSGSFISAASHNVPSESGVSYVLKIE